METERQWEYRVGNLRTLLSEFDKCPLECDGLTRVLHTVLAREKVDHKVYGGHILDTATGRVVSPHLWIEVAEFRVDYRARMWLGESHDVPHGVVPIGGFPLVQYHGTLLDLPLLNDALFQALISPLPSIDELLGQADDHR